MNWLLISVILGLLMHILGDMAEISTTQGKPIHPIQFLKTRPYRIALSVIGAIMGYLIFMNDLQKQIDAELYQTAYATAVGIGYAADSLINKAANIAKNRMDKI